MNQVVLCRHQTVSSLQVTRATQAGSGEASNKFGVNPDVRHCKRMPAVTCGKLWVNLFVIVFVCRVGILIIEISHGQRLLN